MLQELIEDFRQTYSNQTITQEEFNNILDQFGRIDVRCCLDDNVKEQIFLLVQERQNGCVSYYAVETLILEFLIQQDTNIPQIKINPENLGQYAKRIPIDMLESVNNEFLLQFKNFYKLMQNKYGIMVDYRELERLGKELQRTIKINSVEILRYIQPFVDGQQKVKTADILSLANDLEKMLNEQNRQINGMKSPNTITSKIENQHLSSDEETKSEQRQSSIFEKKNFTNIIYQQTDLLRQKLPKKDISCINEINKATQSVEQYINFLVTELESKSKLVEELAIEKELSAAQLQQFELDLSNKEQQIQLLLQDNDYFQAQMNTIQDSYDQLKGQLDGYNEQLKSVTRIETELREQQIDNRKLIEQIQKNKNEVERLTLNNKSLMEIINELENRLNQSKDEQSAVNSNYAEQKIIQNQQDDEAILELQQYNIKLEEQLTSLEKQREGLEIQIIDLKREVTHYKKMYESTNIENQQLRSSIMPRTSIIGAQQQFGLGRMSKLSVNGMLSSQQKIFNIGRISNQRMSSIRGNQQTIFSNFNPLEDGNGNTLKIDSQPEDQQSPQHTIQMRIPPTLQKYDSSVVQSIKEEDEDQTQTVTQTEFNDKQNDQTGKMKNSLLQNFNQFWDGLKNQNLEQSAPDAKCIQFDENILYQRDFLGIRDDLKIVELLKLERKVNKSIIQRCFSDSVYRIDAKGKRARRILFLTEHNFYIFEGEKKPGKLTRQFPIVNIHTVILSEASPVLCCLKIAGSDDYLIETFKRSELNVYLTEIFGSQKAQLFRVDFLAQFKIKFKGTKEEIPISQVSQRQGYLDQGKASAFKVSSKQGSYQPNVGWLSMYRKKMFQGDWQEVFAMLTNVGLILFKKPGDLEPTLFVSIVDAIVIKNPIFETNKQHLIKIRYESSDYEFIFSTTSAVLLEQWHDIIQTTIMEQVRQQNKYLDFQQQQVVEQRTQTLIDQNLHSK